MPELSNFIPSLSFAHCRRSRWNMIEPVLHRINHPQRSSSALGSPHRTPHTILQKICIRNNEERTEGGRKEGRKDRDRERERDESTHHPITAVQYTSGGAKMRSSRLRVPVWNGEAGGMVNTVSAFSRESQLCVRSGLWLWKPERSALDGQHGYMRGSETRARSRPGRGG